MKGKHDLWEASRKVGRSEFKSDDSSEEEKDTVASTVAREEVKDPKEISSFKVTQRELKEKAKGAVNLVINTRKCNYELLNSMNHVVSKQSKWGVRLCLIYQGNPNRGRR